MLSFHRWILSTTVTTFFSTFAFILCFFFRVRACFMYCVFVCSFFPFFSVIAFSTFAAAYLLMFPERRKMTIGWEGEKTIRI